eukprot:TRINITY_DN27973_c0_g1_i1.p2 TRINITY_DN27973_c0_g1~~TRINITY_DN27973_c0_g1_i1.p2  ORF type:complete len:131 (+),score=22.61 TRINITY_DN27973_c0_g1_i1:30-422(+)
MFIYVCLDLQFVISFVDSYISFFFFQAEDGIRDAQESRGLGDVYKRQLWMSIDWPPAPANVTEVSVVCAAPSESETVRIRVSDVEDVDMYVDLVSARRGSWQLRSRTKQLQCSTPTMWGLSTRQFGILGQ